MDKIPVDRTGVERFMLGTDELTVIARGADTGGALFAVEIRMPPGGGPPVMHRHAPGEIYYVQEGQFVFYVGHPEESVRRITASAGEIVPLVGGTPHTIRNETDADARAFVVHAPAAVMENFSYAAADLAANGKADMAAVLELASRSGVDLLGPVPEKLEN
jgi:quercetin dioxygenase-like cupin family protein